MDNTAFRSLLQSAWNKRAALRARTDAFRLLNGAASGTPGLVVDMFSGYAVVYAYDKDLHARYGDFPSVLAEVAGAKAVALKDRAAKDESGREEGADLLGRAPETAVVREGALSFVVHLRHPRNVGLFLDTRPLREMLAAKTGDVLNLFSYACSLGAAAAKGNPGRVVNVDVSSRYLEWGRENYRANGLPEEKGAFARMDCEEYLDWAARKRHAFDAVILDPPSFSRADGSTYAFTRDYPRLLEKCARVTRPGGTVYALTNYAKISPGDFRAQVEGALRGAGRAPASLRPLPPAEDFDPAPPGVPWKPSSEGSLIAFAASLP
jgi:23S rRNA (cytosine1962-C5)-methyltransferase